YFGATPQDPYHGIYSFFPCSPLDERPSGFPRPLIRMDEVTPNHARGYRLTSISSAGHAVELWTKVVRQVLERDGLYLGVRAELPERRHAGGAVGAATAKGC